MLVLETKSTVVTTFLAALVLLLASGAQAETVLFDDVFAPTKATGIDDLVVPGVGIFNVRFKTQVEASEIYGPFPGDLVTLPPFFGAPNSEAASTAINDALVATVPPAVTGVGEVDGSPGFDFYNIGAVAFICCTIPNDPMRPSLIVVRNVLEDRVQGTWLLDGERPLAWEGQVATWAVFTAIGSVCGNGVVDVGEQCDDGNTISGDGCNDICVTEPEIMCGNFVLENGEQCDDGNTTSGDGCSDICLIEEASCGNSVVEVGEQCDDGNTEAGDGCSAICTIEEAADLMVLFDDEAQPSKATGIENMVVPGVGTFDVTFDAFTTAEDVFGPFPGDDVQLPPFSNRAEVEIAVRAANSALNKPQFDALTVGEVDGLPGFAQYDVPDVSFVLEEGPISPSDSLITLRGSKADSPEWFLPGEFTWDWDQELLYAIYKPAPEPSAALLSVAAVGTLILLQRRRRR